MNWPIPGTIADAKAATNGLELPDEVEEEDPIARDGRR
jgi:hypothetical protein